jgi:hypothetical protein
VTEPAMIISMPTIARSQQRYDHRLRNLVQRTGDAVPADLQSGVAAARRTRIEANRSASCEICPSAVPGRVTMEC